MRILVVTAYYPPHHIGGYELGCRDVVNELRRRGHEVTVLTGDFKHAAYAGPEEENVHRLLKTETASRTINKRRECWTFWLTVRKSEPHLIFFWSQAGLCHWFPLLARWCAVPIAFFLSDTSFTTWRIWAWLAGPARKVRAIRAVFGDTVLVRGKPIVQGQPCHFASAFLMAVAKSQDVVVDERNSTVIRWGVETALFSAAPREPAPLRRLLYVGQMIPQKGVHTAILAMGVLAREKEFSDLTLTLAGGGLDRDYEKRLREMPAELGIADRVHFLGKVPRAELPKIYAEHDVLVFPSEWDEPFAITPLEAMAAGLVVVGTTTGGSGELFRNRETAMTFAAGDAGDCARALRELDADPALAKKIRREAQQEVVAHHTLDGMIEAIEGGLKKVIADLPASR